MELIKIRTKNEIQTELIIDQIYSMFHNQASKFEKFTYSRYEIKKRCFNEYQFDNWIKEHDLFSVCVQTIKHENEYPHFKSLYLSNLKLIKEYWHENGFCEHRDCLQEMKFVNDVYKFIKPILAEKLENYVITTNFLSKCTWLDKFKEEFSSFISLFKNPI